MFALPFPYCHWGWLNIQPQYGVPPNGIHQEGGGGSRRHQLCSRVVLTTKAGEDTALAVSGLCNTPIGVYCISSKDTALTKETLRKTQYNYTAG